MSKAKLKVTVKARKGGRGKLVAKIPCKVEQTDSPSGNRLYQTKAQITLRPKTTRNGKPRPSSGH